MMKRLNAALLLYVPSPCHFVKKKVSQHVPKARFNPWRHSQRYSSPLYLLILAATCPYSSEWRRDVRNAQIASSAGPGCLLSLEQMNALHSSAEVEQVKNGAWQEF